jgi:hypothetical protein
MLCYNGFQYGRLGGREGIIYCFDIFLLGLKWIAGEIN